MRRRRRRGLSGFPNPARIGGPAQSWIEPEDVANTILDGNQITIDLPDQTSNNNPLLVLTSGSAKPKLHHAILEGKAVARVLGAEGGQFRTTRNVSEFSLVILLRVITAVNSAVIYDFQAAGAVFQENTVNGGFKYNQASGGAITDVAATMTNWNTIVLTAKQAASNMTIRVNGVQRASFNPHANLWSASGTTDICKNTSDTEIAAFGRYNTQLSSADILDIEGYLKGKFKHYA